MPPRPRISLSPPLLNSATPWATTASELSELYNCPNTGAVTTRTTTLDGFPHDPKVHQHHLFGNSSLNTYGYSPHPLSYYIKSILALTAATPQNEKPFIVSITGTPAEVGEMARTIAAVGLWIEVNLSCPNIPGKPPPAYNASVLSEYLEALTSVSATVPVGIKTPPFTHSGEYTELFKALYKYPTTLSFITATNTLGGCLHLSSPPSLSTEPTKNWQPTLSSAAGTGIGGMAGEALHYLALGNVATLRKGLDEVGGGLEDIAVIGVGGVSDEDGMGRMMSVGASAVGVGTAFGREGKKVFAKILGDAAIIEEVAEPIVGGVKVTLPPN
ncbi:hypothetical protein EDC01DRAFT_181337 [Geopyxis carbonaria]|nr:hypothetical protein EDC01DRAFT_181337 [Geopyxis carbonaria]